MQYNLCTKYSILVTQGIIFLILKTTVVVITETSAKEWGSHDVASIAKAERHQVYVCLLAQFQTFCFVL